MLKTVALVTLVLIAAVLIYAATLPDTFRVARTAHIQAPPETIFPHINSLDRFAAWSPFEKKDPNMKKARSGPSAGKGAAQSWEGDRNAGAGRLEIVEFSAPSKVVMQLDMIQPMEAHNIIEFSLVPDGNATNVTWAMQGKVPYVAKILHVFLDMDRMVGNDFEIGLASLKTVVEN